MRRAFGFATWLLVLAAACGGGDDGNPDMGSNPCEGRADGLSCGSGMICVDEACVPPSCGDGVATGSESCDDGNTMACDGCNADCSREDDDCGDGIQECGEACEPPNTATCSATCTVVSPDCGNGTVGTGEECEPPSTAACDASCQRIPDCGDNFVDAPEVCDGGNETACDGCAADCSRIDADCGDGIQECGEACEPPNTATCSATCAVIVPDCGNGTVGAGEECEPPSTATCDASCQRVPDCGDNFIDAPEVCDGGNETACDGCAVDCSRVDDDCGDGIMECGEACEPPNTATCDASCEVIVPPPVCGDLVLGMGEQCDPPGIPSGNQQCSGTCQLVVDGCIACEAMGCSSFVPFGGVNLVADCYAQTGNAAAGPAVGEPLRVLCAELAACMRSSGCADGGAPVSDCLCGAGVDPTPTACAAQAGLCATEVRAAFETTVLSELLERYVSPDYAGGDATRLVQCDQFMCSTECGL